MAETFAELLASGFLCPACGAVRRSAQAVEISSMSGAASKSGRRTNARALSSRFIAPKLPRLGPEGYPLRRPLAHPWARALSSDPIHDSVPAMQRVIAAFFLLGCASSPSVSPSSPADAAASDASPVPVSPEGGSEQEESEGTAPSSSTEAEGATPPPESPPEINVRNIGLYVKGGANDSASKQPFLLAVEKQFPEFVRCYALIGEPGAEGTFAVDLQVPKKGGQAKIEEEPRTALPGDEFRSCMTKAFRAVVFEPTKKPVVISYSLRFYRGEAASKR